MTSHEFNEREYQQDKPEDFHNGRMTGVVTSKGRLMYPGGMHSTVFASREFEGMNGYWYRVELWRDPALTYSFYRRERGTWIPFEGSQQCQMEKCRLFSIYGEVEA